MSKRAASVREFRRVQAVEAMTIAREQASRAAETRDEDRFAYSMSSTSMLHGGALLALVWLLTDDAVDVLRPKQKPRVIDTKPPPLHCGREVVALSYAKGKAAEKFGASLPTCDVCRTVWLRWP